jgi:hypothetical protein
VDNLQLSKANKHAQKIDHSLMDIIVYHAQNRNILISKISNVNHVQMANNSVQ